MRTPVNAWDIAFNAQGFAWIANNGTVGARSGVSAFIFDGEGGTISAWPPSVAMNQAVTAFDDGSGGAIYKGLSHRGRQHRAQVLLRGGLSQCQDRCVQRHFH
jgi:hypothetical protein